ncbi:hypothetical protein [Aliikangiella sp. IMCC44632]
MDVNDYCCDKDSEEYAQVKSYIKENGTDFETTDRQKANQYLLSLSSRYGPVYIVKDKDLYQFICPASGV